MPGTTIKHRVTLTLSALVVTSTLLVGVYAYDTQMGQLEDTLRDLPRSESALFQSIVARDADGLARAQVGLAGVDALVAPLAARNRASLREAALPFFTALKEQHGVAHMTFILPDATVLLRMDTAVDTTDAVTRATFRQAVATGLPATGMELGADSFLLRSVQAITYRGRPVGYLELAQDIQHVFGCMRVTTGTDVTMLLAQDFMGRHPGVAAGERTGDFILLDSSDLTTGREVAAVLGPALERGQRENIMALLDIGGVTHAVGAAPLNDAGGDPAGVLLFHLDVGARVRAMRTGILSTVLLFNLLVLACGGLLHFSLRRSLALFGQLRRHVLGVTSTWDLRGALHGCTDDEIGQLGQDFNRLTATLARMVNSVHLSVRELNLVSGDIQRVSQQVLQVSERQAADVSVTTSAMAATDSTLHDTSRSAASLAASTDSAGAATEEMAALADKVAGHMEDLVRAVEATASAIARVGASIGTIGRSVDALGEVAAHSSGSADAMDRVLAEVLQRAQSSAAIAQRVLADATAGEEAVATTMEGIRTIRETSESGARVMTRLSASVENVDTILAVIEKVAGQANLLALNASIIAAQAGDQGRSYLVVANQMRNLSRQTKESTQEIAQVLQQVQADTQEAATTIAQGISSVAAGEARAEQAGTALARIVDGVRSSGEQVQQITEAMKLLGTSSQGVRSDVEAVRAMAAELAMAQREQGSAGESIRKSSEQMRRMAELARALSNQQRVQGARVAQESANIAKMTRVIRSAAMEQSQGTGQMVNALHSIRTSGERNLAAVRVLDHSLGRLAAQVVGLQDEVNQFRVHSPD